MVLDLIEALIQKQQQSDEADRFLIRENQRVIERQLEEIMRENVRLRHNDINKSKPRIYDPETEPG